VIEARDPTRVPAAAGAAAGTRLWDDHLDAAATQEAAATHERDLSATRVAGTPLDTLRVSPSTAQSPPWYLNETLSFAR